MTQQQIPEYFIRLGVAIRRRRCARGLTQEQLSDLVPCSRNYVGMVERGEHRLALFLLQRFAEALKTTVHSLARSAKF